MRSQCRPRCRREPGSSTYRLQGSGARETRQSRCLPCSAELSAGRTGRIGRDVNRVGAGRIEHEEFEVVHLCRAGRERNRDLVYTYRTGGVSRDLELLQELSSTVAGGAVGAGYCARNYSREALEHLYARYARRRARLNGRARGDAGAFSV